MPLEVCNKIRFDFRSDIGLRRISNIRHPKKGVSDVEYSTFDGRPIKSKKSDPKKGASSVEYSTFDYAADRIEKIRSDK